MCITLCIYFYIQIPCGSVTAVLPAIYALYILLCNYLFTLVDDFKGLEVRLRVIFTHIFHT